MMVSQQDHQIDNAYSTSIILSISHQQYKVYLRAENGYSSPIL